MCHYSEKRATVVLVLAFAIASCGESPASPSNGPPNTADATALVVSGPTRVVPDTTAQFTATLRMTSGSTVDVTAFATFSPDGLNILESRGRGLMFGRSRGLTALSASYGALRSLPISVTVLEDGTYRLAGTVTRVGGGFLQAEVSALDDSGRHLRSTLNVIDSEYRLDGLGGAVRVTISAPLHATLVEDLVVTEHTWRDFTLAPLAP